MSESMPAGRGEITEEQLRDAVVGSTEQDAFRVKNAWLIGRQDKERGLGEVHERLSFRLGTARVLAELGMLNDAREMYEDIRDNAEVQNEAEIVAKATEALASLPTLH